MRGNCLTKWVIAFLMFSMAGCHRGVARAGPAGEAGSQQPPPPPSAEELNAPPPAPAEEQPDVLTRGPMHEAFAEPVNLQVQAGLVAPSQPPAVIQEIPPAERPEGDRFVWVPGYWAWDGDRNSYIWVSGCWRVAPPNMYWVPGYWSPVAGGWEWVAGFWAPTGAQEIEYLPAPPALEDVEAPGPPPSADVTWVPPCWYWYQGQYVLRPGYWLTVRPDWVWVPSYYVWTPRGYVFCAGHWDFPLTSRGVLFAPVYFPRPVYLQSGFVYSPSIVVDLGVAVASLFVYPRYDHYYFGDYYDDVYVRAGIYPWFESHRIHTWYDPVYEYDHWRFRRTEPRWEERIRHEYDLRRADRQLRPARTYQEQERRLASLPESQRSGLELAQPLKTAVARKMIAGKFEEINTDARRKIARQTADLHKFREERTRWEAPVTTSKEGQAAVVHKPPAVPPPGQKELVPPPAEHKGPVTTPPAVHEGPLTAPPAEHKGPGAPPPVAPEGPVTTPPAEHKGLVMPPPTEHKGPVAPPLEHKGPATPATEYKTPFVPPREVHLKQAERVKIPAPPIVGQPAGPQAVEKGPPARPAEELKHQAEGEHRSK